VKSRARRVAAGLIVAYLLTVGLLAALERTLLFPAPTLPEGWLAAEAQAQGAREIRPVAEDGTRLYGWHLPAPTSRGVVVWFEGNGGSVGMRPGAFRRLTEDGWDVVHVNYRGYPGSDGAPNEDGLRMDARAAWAVAKGAVQVLVRWRVPPGWVSSSTVVVTVLPTAQPRQPSARKPPSEERCASPG
jgi:hypothetical protein